MHFYLARKLIRPQLTSSSSLKILGMFESARYVWCHQHTTSFFSQICRAFHIFNHVFLSGVWGIQAPELYIYIHMCICVQWIRTIIQSSWKKTLNSLAEVAFRWLKLGQRNKLVFVVHYKNGLVWLQVFNYFIAEEEFKKHELVLNTRQEPNNHFFN